MRTRRFAVIAAVLGIATGCATAPAAPAKPPPTYAGHFSRFPTGLRMVSYQLPRATRGVVVASYLGGSADDPPGKEGLAVLAGRLAQRARPGGTRLADEVLASGVESGHDVGPDALVLWQTGDAGDVEAMLRVEGHRLRDPAAGITQADLDRERDALVASLSAPPESGDAAPIAWLSQLAFAGHAYGRAALGTPSTLQSITLADVRQWLAEHVTPAGAVLVVTSASAPAEAERLLVPAFGALATGDPGAARTLPRAPTARPAIVPASPRSSELRRTAGSRTSIWLGWPLPADSVADRAHAVRAAVSAEIALENGLGRDASEEVLRVVAGVRPGTAATLVTVRLDLADDEAAPRVLREALEVLDRPFAIADDAALTRFARSQSPVRFAAEVARHVQLTARPDLASEWSSVNASEAEPWVRNLVTGKRAAALTIAPDAATPARPTPLLRLTSVLETTGSAFDASPIDDDALAETIAARSPHAAPAPVLHRRVLPNGLTLVALPTRDQELYGRLVVRNPGRELDDNIAGVLALATGRRTFSFFGDYSCWSSVGIAVDAVHFTNVAHPDASDRLLERLGCWTKGIAAQSETFEHTDALRKRFEAASRSPAVRGWDAMRAALYPGHAQSRPLAASGRKVDKTAAQAWMKDALRPARATVLFVGDIAKPAALLDDAARSFEQWKPDAAPAPAAAHAPWPERRRVILVPQPGARGAHVTVAVRIPSPDRRDDAAQYALERLLETRIAALRSDVSLSGILVARQDGGAGSSMLASAEVRDLNASTAIKRMLEAVSGIATAPPPEPLVRRAGLELVRYARMRVASSDVAMAFATHAVAIGEPLDAWNTSLESAATLSPSRVQAAARALATGREVVVVIGEPWIADDLAAAGFEVERLPLPDEPT